MAHDIDMEKHRLAEIRWRILRAVDSGDGWAIAETLVLSILNDLSLNVTPSELRKKLRYLEGKGLVSLHKTEEPTWMVAITPDGTDIVQYVVPCPAGIGRPQRYF